MLKLIGAYDTVTGAVLKCAPTFLAPKFPFLTRETNAKDITKKRNQTKIFSLSPPIIYL
jgi:hypothetical protein